MKEKTNQDSMTEMTQLVLPNDTNLLGNLLGGTLMHWIDIAGAMTAMKHAGNNVVTAAIDSVDFKHPIRLGDIVTLCAQITWTGTTSMEVMVIVYTTNIATTEQKVTNKAYMTFVAVDKDSKPIAVPELLVGQHDFTEFRAAQKRREQRLARRAE